jgi:hypothetical protein
MTEAEWLAAGDPAVMVWAVESLDPESPLTPDEYVTLASQGLVRQHAETRRYDRKMRLFACACVRRVWHLLGAQGRRLVEAAERYADKRCRVRELDAGIQASFREAHGQSTPAAAGGRANRRARARAGARELAREAARAAGGYCGFSAAFAVLRPTAVAAKRELRASSLRANAVAEESRAQADLLRDILANLFCPQTAPAFGGGAGALAIAGAIYADGSFGDLPVLADALEDAGCTEAELLGHLRSPGPHVRGCWALDLILSKDR